MTNNFIFVVLQSWLPEWCTLASSAVEAEKSIAQRKKDEAKLWMAQLEKKYWNEAAAAKAQEAWDTAKATKEQQKATEKEHEGQKLPSLVQETNLEEGGADPQITSTQLK